MRRTLLYTIISCRLSTDPEMYDLGWLWMAWMFIIRNSIGCGQCRRPKMLSDIFSFSFTLLLPNWLLISIRIYSGIARFPCDSMAFLSCICDWFCRAHRLLTKRYVKRSTCRLSSVTLRNSPTGLICHHQTSGPQAFFLYLNAYHVLPDFGLKFCITCIC